MDREKVLEEQVKFLREENAKLQESKKKLKLLVTELFAELRGYVDPDDSDSLVSFSRQPYRDDGKGEVGL